MSSSMFRSFSVFNYRVWFIGALVSNVGQCMQGTALSWVVLTQLTHNDAGAMGITMALQFAPPLLLVGVTGWVADRFDRRRLLMLTQSLLLVIGAVIGSTFGKLGAFILAIVLGLFSWTGLARLVRGEFLTLRRFAPEVLEFTYPSIDAELVERLAAKGYTVESP